jgi:NAD(P)-dependent dehydrogenase (short-subunit alcohol dehydrogenase family)
VSKDRAAEPPAILVTGAGGQLGSAIARGLAARECRLVLTDVAAERLDALRNDLLAEGGWVAVLAQDITTTAGARAVVSAALDTAGRVDVCINAAGIEGPIGPIEEADMADVVRVFDVNVFGTMRVMQAVIPRLVGQGGGRIINIASGAGLAGSANMAPYSSSKHAVIGLTRSAAVELAPRGVSVNAVCPGCVSSPMMQRIETTLASRSQAPTSFAATIPMGRFAEPDEIAGLVTYLSLDAPAYMTGAALVIDGGMRA